MRFLKIILFMDIYSIILIAVGLAMDSFAVCIGQSVCRKRFVAVRSLKIALVFGFFQGAMPLIGYVLGIGFAQWISHLDHWFAFVILGAIGGKMIYESLQPQPDAECFEHNRPAETSINWKKVAVLSFATSIDAMATGLIFVSYPGTILTAILTIGLITVFFAFLGMLIGVHFGGKMRVNVEMLGGIILIGIGLKILLEHTLVG